MAKILHEKLSYEIIKAVFDVYNSLGYGYQEKVYQKALSLKFEEMRIVFEEQVCCKMVFNGVEIAKYFLDLLVEKLIVVELKVGGDFYKRDYEQIRNYLKANSLELGILVIFSKKGVKYKRVLNKLDNLERIRIDSDDNSD